MKILKFLAVAIILLLLAGAGYQWMSSVRDRNAFPPPGSIHQIDSLAMHIDCRGHGNPTVVLEAGLGSGSSSWVRVHDSAARNTRVCAYDRAGMDWSEPADAPLTAPGVAKRLHALLAAEGIDGPKILVGMSAGGVFIREYFARYPEDVIGMVLVDSSHEQQGDRLPPLDMTRRDLLSICALLQPIGLVRAFGLMDGALDAYQLEESHRSRAVAMANQSHSCRAVALESDGFESEILDPHPPASLGDLPLIVLSQGKQDQDYSVYGVSTDQALALRAAWTELQLELAALSSNSQHRIATDSGHVIQMEQPQLVIDAINEMVGQ